MHALLLLSDGRFPNGGYAHSGGLEAAVSSGAVADMDSLARWLNGRLMTGGVVEAAFGAAAWGGATRRSSEWTGLEAELAARVSSAATRRASRAQGRGVLRAAQRCWPHPVIDDLRQALPEGPLWPVALGAAAAAAGLGARDAALAAATSAVSGAAWAGGRLLGLDPFGIARVLADLGPAIDSVAQASVGWARPGIDPASLPTAGAPELDIGAELHARWEVRLFAS